jgi:hypothetical protein
MSRPTSGRLTVSASVELDRCNPSFVWSDDSRYLAVPQWFQRFGVLRRQRMVVIDVAGRSAVASPEMARYFQPESFSGGVLVATKDPFGGARRVRWQIPDDLRRFTAVALTVP